MMKSQPCGRTLMRATNKRMLDSAWNYIYRHNKVNCSILRGCSFFNPITMPKLLPLLKIHFDPFKPSYDPYGEDVSEQWYCWTLLAECDNSTNNEHYVTCKKCIKLFDKARAEIAQAEQCISDEMWWFVDFISKHENQWIAPIL